ncbi:MAG: pilus assembly protein N-terminal domain-containing protein [Deltaproteobacteria bacterium]|nr:pilus assembly protein N-terminal domain-containing protein [Deltaproteobacteria bacterium]
MRMRMPMRTALGSLVAVLAALGPVEATARPVGKVFDLPVGKEEFFRAWLNAAFVDEPSVATAEMLPSREVLLTAHKPGRALLLLLGETNLEAVRLRVHAVGEKPPQVRSTEEQRAAARKACPGLKEEGKEAERSLSATVSSAGCREALRELLAADEYSSRRIELSFSAEALQDQLGALQAAQKAKGGLEKIQLGYSGATLTLKGKATEAQRLELMKIVFDVAIGPILFEDSTETVEESKRAKPAALDPAPPGPGPSK